MSDLFYVFGIALTVAALVLSFIGLKSERFPSSRGLYTVVLGAMGALVVASCAFAVVLSREEAEHHAEEYAEFAEEEAAVEAEGAEAAAAEPDAGAEGQEIEAQPPKEAPLEITSPEDGALLFEPDSLEAAAGNVTIDYTNPSEVPHNVAIEGDGEELAQGETVTGGDTGSAEAALEAGEYVFYCSIPGHRESGMEGILTVTE